MQIEAFETAIAEEQEAAASLAVAGEVFDMKRGQKTVLNQAFRCVAVLTYQNTSLCHYLNDLLKQVLLVFCAMYLKSTDPSPQELAAIQVEAEYRRRIKTVHSEVKKRLVS